MWRLTVSLSMLRVGLPVLLELTACGGGTATPAPAPPTALTASAPTASAPTASAPTASAPTTPNEDAGLDASVQHNLARINEYRAKANLQPYELDAALTRYALEGSRQLARDNRPHGHMKDVGMQDFGTMRRENQGPPKGVRIDPANLVPSVNERIDRLLANMMSEGPGGGHHDAIMSSHLTKVGIGLEVEGDRLFITNDFSN